MKNHFLCKLFLTGTEKLTKSIKTLKNINKVNIHILTILTPSSRLMPIRGAPMEHSYQKLLAMTGGKKFLITQVRIPEDNITIAGDFQLPPFADLSMEDQIFIAAFVKTNGSIKQMESIFNISYPTVKNRLNRIASQLDIVDVSIQVTNPMTSILDRIETGSISVAEALKEIE